jgi:integrase
VWRIPAGRSKNHRTVAIALSADAVEILNKRHRERGTSPWIFPSPASAAKQKHLVEVRRAWARICASAGLAGVIVHDIRRSVGTMVASSGAGAAIIAAVLGHADQRSARAYVHLSAEMARAAIEGVARKISDAA